MKPIRVQEVVRLFVSVALLAGLLGFALPVAADGPEGAGASYMPPEPDKIAAALVKRGVIPANATPEQKDAAVSAYLQAKLQGEEQDYNPMARKRLAANEEALNAQASSAIRGRKLGQSVEVTPSTPQFKPLTGTGKLLVMLVEFSDTPYTWTPVGQAPRTAAGPLHNQMPVPDNSFDLWVPDFGAQHFQNMIFNPGGWTFPTNAPRYAGEHRGSMRDYYVQQSFGQYTIDGKVYGWYKVDKPEAYYGDDNPAGGHDDLLPGTTKDLIQDTVNVINASGGINWAEYDTESLYTWEGAGKNCDCIIDHPLFVHAGADQSGGGGAQGDDAIWAHSSMVPLIQVEGKSKECPKGRFIYNYTIMPEDGGVGVFAHEFGHDLGLPDEYDTIYSGRGDSVAFWSLMSSGSWVGKPAQTQPPDISIWGRYALGWLGDSVASTDLSNLGKNPVDVRLEQSARWGGPGTLNALRVNLPDKTLFVNTPHSGGYEWFGGKADEIDTTLRRTVNLTGKSSATLSFWTWYDIESQWDYGFVQVSTDNGVTWKSLPIAGTTSDIVPDGYPAIKPNMPGFTGSSGGWVQKTYDLKDYVGKSIQLQFRYMTDWGTTMAGFFIDDISVTADGVPLFSDSVETLDAAWAAKGWSRYTGSEQKAHYYMLEWRNIRPLTTPYNGVNLVNFDAGLNNVYQFDAYGSTGNPNEPWWYRYNPGLVLWYRDTSYTDNWTGVHPGGGFLLVVDAHEQAMLRPPVAGGGSLPWNSQVQSYDATFGLDPAVSAALGYWGVSRTYAGLNAQPSFDDSHSYWSQAAPAASVKTPTYGLVFRVLGQATDGSAALIGLGTK